jgi:hypothetical protein
MRFHALVVLGVCSVFAGCDRTPTAPQANAPASPTTQPTPAAVQPATRPLTTAPVASTQPATSFVMIDNQRVEFPPAKLSLQSRDGKVHALLMSDDPPAAISQNYTGNSFYIEMTVDDVDDVNDVPGAMVQYQAPQSTEREDSPNGIFLEGGKKQLQPDNIKVEFESAGSKMAVRMTGTFVIFDTQDETIPSRQVPVSTRLLAVVKK